MTNPLECNLELVECCGNCHEPIGKKSKRIKCGYCGARFICPECRSEKGYHKLECSEIGGFHPCM